MMLGLTSHVLLNNFRSKHGLIIVFGIFSLLLTAILFSAYPRIVGSSNIYVAQNDDGEKVLITGDLLLTYVRNVTTFLNYNYPTENVVILPTTGATSIVDWRKYHGGYFGFDYYSMLLEGPTNSSVSNDSSCHFSTVCFRKQYNQKTTKHLSLHLRL